MARVSLDAEPSITVLSPEENTYIEPDELKEIEKVVRKRESNFTFESKNYDGYTFANALATQLAAAVDGFVVEPTFNFL